MTLKYSGKSKKWHTLAAAIALTCSPLLAEAQRVALKTNALYWAAATPNIGAEFRINRHITFNFEAAYNRIKVFNIDTRGAAITPEVRYWFSARPQAGHFLGIAGIGCDYNFVHNGKRHIGDLYGGGLTYGYSFVLSKRWSLEATIGAGMAHCHEMSWNKEEPQPNSANVKEWKPIPVKAGISFVYLLR